MTPVNHKPESVQSAKPWQSNKMSAQDYDLSEEELMFLAATQLSVGVNVAPLEFTVRAVGLGYRVPFQDIWTNQGRYQENARKKNLAAWEAEKKRAAQMEVEELEGWKKCQEKKRQSILEWQSDISVEASGDACYPLEHGERLSEMTGYESDGIWGELSRQAEEQKFNDHLNRVSSPGRCAMRRYLNNVTENDRTSMMNDSIDDSVPEGAASRDDPVNLDAEHTWLKRDTLHGLVHSSVLEGQASGYYHFNANAGVIGEPMHDLVDSSVVAERPLPHNFGNPNNVAPIGSEMQVQRKVWQDFVFAEFRFD